MEWNSRDKNMDRIPLSKPIFTKEMEEAAIDALQNEFFVLGESVYKFEEEFARYIGTKFAISVNSGTFALTASLIAFNFQGNTPILTTPMSFVATANSIIHAGYTPEFTDIKYNSGNINITSLSKKYKAIIPVHLYGNPCNMEELLEFKEKTGMIIIEDACQSHGSTYNNKKLGSIGDVGCFSFYSTKNMTVGGDGGMVTTDNKQIAEKIINLRDCGRISKYEHTTIGYTARLNSVNAAIGRVQLKYLDAWNENRRNAANIYNKKLPDSIKLDYQKNCIYHIYAVQVENRHSVIDKLNKNGIDTGIHYPIPIHLQPVYKRMFGYKEGDYPMAEKFSKNILSLPLYPEITSHQVEYICEKLCEEIDCE